MSTQPEGTPTWEELDAQFDYEYMRPKKLAAVLRAAGVPPMPVTPEERVIRDELIRRQAEYAQRATPAR